MKTTRTALDGARRRRIYLFRHGSVDYVDKAGNVVDDTRLVNLNQFGREQALAMSDFFADVQIDTAYCSDLRRTRQTGEVVLGDRNVSLETMAALSEIAAAEGQQDVDFDVLRDVAFSHWQAHDDAARFLGGESYREFYARIESLMRDLVVDSDWQDLALFAHGGTNAAILGWVSGVGRAAFGVFDQATCCLNVIDIDTDGQGSVIRKTIRAMNLTVDDPTKAKRHGNDMELLARRLIRQRGNSQ